MEIILALYYYFGINFYSLYTINYVALSKESKVKTLEYNNNK